MGDTGGFSGIAAPVAAAGGTPGGVTEVAVSGGGSTGRGLIPAGAVRGAGEGCPTR